MRPVREFCDTVFDWYKKGGRQGLPWRLDTSPWGVLVSEFMLQQTQIERVIPYWLRWLARWPDPAALAAAPLADALREWSGLGYNRRCRFLWECAAAVRDRFGGAVPDDPRELRSLPGIGPYCAGAIACFAYNRPSAFIETNIRAALIGFFFPPDGPESAPVDDTRLIPLLEEALRLPPGPGTDERPAANPRLWYWALMDYGAMIKKTGPNPNRRSAHYVRQSPFEGSFRQVRSAILRLLLEHGPARAATLSRRAALAPERVEQALLALEKDRLITSDGPVYTAR